MANLNEGDSIPELKVTPDEDLTKRYAEASGDFNPIHIDPEFAKTVGPARLHPARPLDDGPGRARQQRGRRRRPARAEAALGPVPRHGLSRAGADRHRHRQGGRRRTRSSSTPSPSRAATRSSATPRPSSRLDSSRRGAPRPDPRISRVLSERQQADPRARWSRATSTTGRPVGSKRDRGRAGLGVEPLDDPGRAGEPRGRAASSPIPTPRRVGSRPTPATASTSSSCSPPSDRLPAPRPGRAAALADAARGRRGDPRDDRGALADHRPGRAGQRAAAAARRRSTGSRCCCLQPRTVMVVVIASNGGVSQARLHLPRPRSTPAWSSGRRSYLNERLVGLGLGRADGRRPPRRPRAGRRPSAASSTRSAAPSPTSRTSGRGDPLRGRRRAAALRGALGRPPARRGADARRSSAGSTCCARCARRSRSARSSPGSATRTRSPSCARSASSAPTTGSATATSARSA